MTTLTLAPPRYHLRRIIGYLPETRAHRLLTRLNDILALYHTLPTDHPLVSARDNLAYALAASDGIDAAAGLAAGAMITAMGGAR